MKLIFKIALLFAMLFISACKSEQSNEGSSAEVSIPYEKLDPDEQIVLAHIFERYGLSINNEEYYEIDLNDIDSLPDYMSFIANSVTGLKEINKTLEYEDEYRLKRIWDAFIFNNLGYGYYDNVDITVIDKFIEHRNQYIKGNGYFPRWEFKKRMSEISFIYSKISNHGGNSLDDLLSLEYFMEYGLSGLKSIRDIAEILSDDGKAGVINIESGYNFDWDRSIILLESEDGIFCDLWGKDVDNGTVFTSITQEDALDGSTIYHFKSDLENRPHRDFRLMDGHFKEL